MNTLYNIGVRAYVAGIKIAAACGHRKATLMEAGRKDWESRLRESLAKIGDSKRIWFHAASLGEFEQGRPIIEALREQHPEYKIVQTFFSPSGYEVRKNYKGADVVCYLPYDLKSDVRKFVEMVNPEMAFIVKYEFWGNVLEALQERNIPAYLVSGIFRDRQVFFKPWGGLMRPVLGMFRHLFVQDEESLRLLATLGIRDNVTICGDTRFDRVIAIQQQAKVLPWAEKFRASSEFIMVAGSSWPKDEDIFIEHFNNHPEMKLIIAPHEIHEEHVQSILAKLKRPVMRYSQLDENKVVEADCLIIDAIGFLSSIYRYGDVAYIGGGFGVGIHNTLEAAVYGMPVIFGPNHTAFREALGLIDAKGGLPINGADDYNRIMTTFLSDKAALQSAGEAAGKYVTENSGATETIFNAVFGK